MQRLITIKNHFRMLTEQKNLLVQQIKNVFRSR